ncbi:hypothetical protein F4774DRAFT_245913 [Daldinia eschscholtzii]|nr:hypothetical protein F4774DRAFT_245913 [Daldinia eschscholtzii]
MYGIYCIGVFFFFFFFFFGTSSCISHFTCSRHAKYVACVAVVASIYVYLWSCFTSQAKTSRLDSLVDATVNLVI